MYNMQKHSNPKKLILVATDMAMKCEAVLKYVMWHIKTISMEGQSRCNEQQAKVLQLQEVDLGGHGHGQEFPGRVEVGHVAHQNNQHEKAKKMQ